MKKLLATVILSTIALTGCDNKVTYDCGDEKFVLKGGRLISNGYVIEHEFDNTYKLDTWAGTIRYTLLDNGIDAQFSGMKKIQRVQSDQVIILEIIQWLKIFKTKTLTTHSLLLSS